MRPEEEDAARSAVVLEKDWALGVVKAIVDRVDNREIAKRNIAIVPFIIVECALQKDKLPDGMDNHLFILITEPAISLVLS
jgi:hypothetical protein